MQGRDSNIRFIRLDDTVPIIPDMSRQSKTAFVSGRVSSVGHNECRALVGSILIRCKLFAYTGRRNGVHNFRRV
jgi:hypothetical protein